jgi:hypothetical protein
MNRKHLLLVCIFFILVSLGVAENVPVKFKYVGAKKCGECHMTKEIGNQYMRWLVGRHSHAYWRLAGDWAKFLARQRPKYKDITEPIKEQRCLKCHYTGAEEPAEAFADSFYKEEGVGCEACHGPGSAYIALPVMKDKEKFLQNGGIIPGEKTCTKCHRNPAHFKFEEWVKKIHHPIPKKQEEKGAGSA